MPRRSSRVRLPAGRTRHADDACVRRRRRRRSIDGNSERIADAGAIRRPARPARTPRRAPYDPRIVAVNAHVIDELQEVWIATSDGRIVHDRRPMVTLGVQAVASDGNERGSGYVGDGGRTSIAYFDAHTPEELARRSGAHRDHQRRGDSGAGRRDGDGRRRRRRRRAAARGGRARTRERLQSARDVALQRPRRRARRKRTRHDLRRRQPARRARHRSPSTTKACPGSTKCWSRSGVLRGYMQDTLNARLMGVDVHRKRPAPVVPLPAAAAHVQHVHARRARASVRRNHRIDASAAFTRNRLPAARSRSARATSSSWSPKAT